LDPITCGKTDERVEIITLSAFQFFFQNTPKKADEFLEMN